MVYAEKHRDSAFFVVYRSVDHRRNEVDDGHPQFLAGRSRTGGYKGCELDDQYMFGSDILFAPIMERRQTATVQAELEQFIAFVPEGSPVLHIFADQ